MTQSHSPHMGSSALLAFPSCPTFKRQTNAEQLDEEQRLALDRLRWMALRSRLAPKPDFERACFLLAGEDDVSFERFSVAFFRGLDAKAKFRMEFYRPGTSCIGDDELWLMRLVDALRGGRGAESRALVAWRVHAAAQRWLRFLAAGTVRAMDRQVSLEFL